MISRHFSAGARQFTDHPKFSGVKMAVFVTGNDSAAVSVCQLIIAPGITIPVHTHDRQGTTRILCASFPAPALKSLVSQESWSIRPA